MSDYKWRELPRDYPQHPPRRPALVVGASSGIGRACAVALAAAGFPVAVAARRRERLAEVVEYIRARGGEALAVPMDVSSTESIRAAVDTAEAELGDLDVLIYSVGSVVMGRVWEISTDTFAAQVDMHLLSVQRVLAEVAPRFIARTRGDIVLIGSDTARTNRPVSGAYPAAKAGMDTLTFQLQAELEGTGVRATVVRPGPTATEIADSVDHDTLDDVITTWVAHGHGRHGRMCNPEQLAHAVLGVVTLSRGAYIRELEVQPEAPISD